MPIKIQPDLKTLTPLLLLEKLKVMPVTEENVPKIDEIVDILISRGYRNVLPEYLWPLLELEKKLDVKWLKGLTNGDIEMTPENDDANYKTYQITIKSRFIITQSAAKRAFGPGFNILAVETAIDADPGRIVDVDSAIKAMIKTGYRALARAYHPDLGGDTEKMQILTRAKKEFEELLKGL